MVAVVATLIGMIFFLKRKGSLIEEKQNEISDSTLMKLKIKT